MNCTTKLISYKYILHDRFNSPSFPRGPFFKVIAATKMMLMNGWTFILTEQSIAYA